MMCGMVSDSKDKDTLFISFNRFLFSLRGELCKYQQTRAQEGPGRTPVHKCYKRCHPQLKDKDLETSSLIEFKIQEARNNEAIRNVNDIGLFA